MNRFELEHKILPERFFADCRGMIKSLETNGADYVKKMYDELDCKFEPQDFDAGILDYEGGVNICRLFVPRPSAAGECVIIYLIYSKENEPMRVLTVEMSADGGYELKSFDADGNCEELGPYDGRSEQGTIDKAVKDILMGGAVRESGKYGEMCELLNKFEIPYYEDEVLDYIQMFDVIEELTCGALTLGEMTEAFKALIEIVKGEEFETSHDKIKREYAVFEELPATKKKLDHKGKLFFAFCVYAAYSIISENDEKKHNYMGIAEFESADYIKYRMEEYWSMDPYMFKVE